MEKIFSFFFSVFHTECFTNLDAILTQGPCESSLHRSSFSIRIAEASLDFLTLNEGPRKGLLSNILRYVSSCDAWSYYSPIVTRR